MQQLSFFNPLSSNHIVNVASVPQRSPFRYPGGKTWLVPYIRRWLSPQIRQEKGLLPVRPTHFIEPFAGGGIVSLTVAAEKYANRVIMVEIDEDVAAVWQAILDERQSSWITQALLSFELTDENVEAFLAKTNLTPEEQAFRTILRNRINRGGILAPGAGRIKNGEGGKGMKSRWYPGTLEKRIREIVRIKDTLSFIHGDGIAVMQDYAGWADTVFFIDPPYTAPGKKAGSRLYTYWDVNHEELFEIASRLQGDFLMTYDDTPYIRSLAQQYDFATESVSMKNTHHARMRELLIGRNLSWLGD